MARHTRVGIDIGTSQTKIVVAESIQVGGRTIPKIIGTGIVETRGLARGYVADAEEVSSSLRQALARAEKSSGIKIKRAHVSFGGVGLNSITTTASIVISRADLEITKRDLEQVLELAENAIPKQELLNRKILNTVPIEYKMDGKVMWGRVEGLKAHKLEVKALFITCLEHHLADLIQVVERAGVEVEDVVAGPVATSIVTLGKMDKKAGCLLADIGAETLSIVVYENGGIVSLEVFPVGGMDITNDLALGLKIPIDEAESVKLGAVPRSTSSRRKPTDIISARLDDCFELIDQHLKKIGRDALLPAGIIMTGGTVGIDDIKKSAENSLKLPARIADIYFGGDEKNKVRDNIWATACGLSLIGFSDDDNFNSGGFGINLNIFGNWKKVARKTGDWISQFLP